jgi:uncharacterized protein YkwD
MTDPSLRCQYPALLLLALLVPLLARADILDSVNAVRDAGCTGGTKGARPLQQSARLDEVAHHLADGASLHSAQQQAGYRAVISFSVSIADVPASGDVRRVIESQFCAQSTNPAFREIGVWRAGSDVWLAFATPFTPPALGDRAEVSTRVLDLINAARASAQHCGSAPFPAAPPLTRHAALERAAQEYAQDMASYGYMDHIGRDGSAPHERITRSGYRWSETGENLANGVMTPEALVDGWLHSPEHCANLLDPAYTQMGVGFAVNPRNEMSVYWALELGRPSGK